MKYQEFYPSKSKNILDQINREFARALGLTQHTLDFILNYDAKYRFGDEVCDD